jgi:hypothetical protein
VGHSEDDRSVSSQITAIREPELGIVTTADELLNAAATSVANEYNRNRFTTTAMDILYPPPPPITAADVTHAMFQIQGHNEFEMSDRDPMIQAKMRELL